ncbi:PBECR2 nuclease fold domain-containing protein, partial [Campylobacter upsaliensis]|uniref:putative barnase/colicin E5 family endoribonuclease n=1 Tax=Campylobacter upsaliensis TaxID=28080 RepID=UPI002149A899
VKGSGKEAKGYGLSKIIEKHGEDFKEFGEDLEGVSKGLDEIITKGEIHTQEYGRKTIIYHKNGEVYKVGLKQNWKGEPTKNSWVITSYKEDREADKFIHSSGFTKGETLPLNSEESIAQKSPVLNNEPLEVEVIEEIGLNEPMKFLEFQQRKLLTYIKQNTPLRLLEHKKELKTRELLNFLEQSALNGKEKAFLMRHLERDLTKLKETKGSEDIIFTDTKGKEHTLTKEVQELWLEAFNLKSLDEAYIPNFTPEVKQALDSILQGEVIKLYAGSLVKLIKENRLKYLDRIKPTLEQPQRIILQNDGALIFARNFGEEKYFTSVARNDNGEWIIRSNAPKAENGLNNKISAGGKEIYNSQAANQINAHNPYDDIAKSNIKLDNNIIPQTTQEIIKQAKASGKSVKETKELIDKNKELQEHIESTPQKVDNSTSQSLAQTKLSPSAQAKKALKAKQAKQIYEFFTAKGTNKDKITTLENFSDFMFELNKKLDRKWEFLEQQSPNDLAKYKQILTEGIEQAEQVGRISPKQKQRALQDLDLLIDNFSYIKDTHLYSFHPSKVSETLHKIQYKAYDLEDLSDDEFIKIFFYKKLPKTLDEDFEREFSKRKDRIYPFLKPMLAKDNYLEYISEQNLKDFFYKGVLRDEAIPEMIAKEKGVKIQDLSIAKIQDFKINSPRQSIEQALEIKPLKEFGTNYA